MASLADSLWHRNRVLAEAALEHPFVQGIASGELARATFAYYVGQDAAFLDAFCRAYALALAKSPDQDGLIAFRELLDAAAEELRLHRGYADRWDVDLHQAADPATAAYTNFLLAVAALEPVGHIAAAMTPCMRLYAYLGQQLADQTKPDSPYREWVMTYSSAQFEALARRVEGLLDRYGGSRPPGRPVSPGDGTRTAVLRRCRPMRETMTADALMSRHAAAWQAATVHPFLAGVRDGSLPEHSFDRWLAQDYLFAQALVRAQSRIAATAPLADVGLLAGGVVATVGELGWFEEMAARRGLALDAAMHPATRAYCDFLLAVTYSGYPAQITAIWALERTYLESWDSARPGAQPYREFVNRWTTDGFRSYVGDLQSSVDRQLEASVGEQAREAEDAFLWVTHYERGFWDMAMSG